MSFRHIKPPVIAAAKAGSAVQRRHRQSISSRNYRDALRRKPMALLNLVYREQLFPREPINPPLEGFALAVAAP